LIIDDDLPFKKSLNIASENPTYIMKTIAFCLFVCFSVSLTAQSNCVTPLSGQQFQQLRRNVLGVQASQQKYQNALNIVNGNCITTVQLIDLMGLFANDAERLDIAVAGMNHVTNQQDFYDVLNAFANFSTAFHLYDYVTGRNQVQVEELPVLVPLPVIPQLSFPQLNYPDVYSYNGKGNCNTSLAENDFLVYAQEINFINNDQQRFDRSFLLAKNNCLSTAQAMKLATLLNLETLRMQVLKTAYDRVYDEGNFGFAEQVFNHGPNKAALADFIAQRRRLAAQQQVVVPPPCLVSDAEFKMVKEPLARESSSITRVSIAKAQIPNYRCYTSSQMKEIVALFTSSIDRLDIAKFAYDFVSDKQSYFYAVSPLFSSSIDRESLSAYIVSKGR